MPSSSSATRDRLWAASSLGKPFINRSGTAVEIADPGLVGHSRQHGVDERVVVGAWRDDVERDGDGAFEFLDGLLEIESLLRQRFRQLDDRLPFQALLLGWAEEPLRLQKCDQFLGVEPKS